MNSLDRLYLHFLDREACKLSNSYSLGISKFTKVFDVVATMSYEIMTLSGGHLFEHKAAQTIYSRYPSLFLSRQIITIGDADLAGEFVEKKFQQYAHTLEKNLRDYSVYVGDNWKHIFSGPLQFLRPVKSTTPLLAENLKESTQLNSESLKVFREIIEEREQKAITAHLFDQVGRFSSLEMSQISKNISSSYSLIYRELYGQKIFAHTGLINPAIETLASQEFDFRLYNYFFNYFSIDLLMAEESFDLNEFRGSAEQVNFIKIIRSSFSKTGYDNLWKIGNLLKWIMPEYKKENAIDNVHQNLQEFTTRFQGITNIDLDDLFDEYERNKNTQFASAVEHFRWSEVSRKSVTGDLLEIIVTATASEFAVVCSVLEAGALSSEGIKVNQYEGKSFSFENIDIICLTAHLKGSNSLHSLFRSIDKQYPHNKKNIYLVGMMAAIPGKTDLLNVVVPNIIFDVSAQGTKAGKTVGEPRPYMVNPILHKAVQNIEWNQIFPDFEVNFRKQTLSVSAKMDDVRANLFQTLMPKHDENIVGLEEEGGALGASELFNLEDSDSSKRAAHIMIKGTADYIGKEISSLDEIKRLSKISEISPLLSEPDPTFNLPLKNALQKEATIRAAKVAIHLIKSQYSD